MQEEAECYPKYTYMWLLLNSTDVHISLGQCGHLQSLVLSYWFLSRCVLITFSVSFQGYHVSCPLCYHFFPPFVNGISEKWLLFNPSKPNLFIFQLLMPQVKFHWLHQLCRFHEKKNAFQVHRLLISLCLPGQGECRAIFTLFQRSFSLLKIMAYQWTGTTSNELMPEQWMAEELHIQDFTFLLFAYLGKGGEYLIIFFFLILSITTRYSGRMKFSCYSLSWLSFD